MTVLPRGAAQHTTPPGESNRRGGWNIIAAMGNNNDNAADNAADNAGGGARRWVIKVGSSLVTDGGCGLNRGLIGDWAAQIARLVRAGGQVALVSSGSIAEGVSRLGWRERPQTLHALQAAAAVGQMGLMQGYREAFASHGVNTAQVLLTHEDFRDRQRYLNARATLTTLLELGVAPVINENDTVSTDEIQLGDNDTLAAQVANLVDADLLLMLTNQRGLFSKDPNRDDGAELIRRAHSGDTLLDDAAGPSIGELGRGGMITKVAAARCAAQSGASTIIAPGQEPDVIARIAAGEALGTLIQAGGKPLALRKRWIANLKPRGALTLDDGACRALCDLGKSLLPVGVAALDGDFRRGDMVVCRSASGDAVARGLANYAADEARLIIGKSGGEVKAIMGARYEEELIHRDNLALDARFN